MEKVFFAKIEAWIVFLVVIILIIGSILFAYIAQERARGSSIGGSIGEALYEVARSPELVKRMLDEAGETKGRRVLGLDPRIATSINSFAGLENVPGYIGTRSDAGGVKTFELKKISTGKTALRWLYPVGNFPAAVSFFDNTLIVKDTGGFEDASNFLRKLDKSGQELWATPIPAHHAVHVDPDGYVYTPVVMPEHENSRFVENYRDDGYAILSPGGEIIDTGSVTDILAGNGLGHLIYGVGPIEWDPIHLNSVKPAPTSTRYWNQGDLLMSSRHLSLVFLYRPDTGKVIWHHAGPWLNQHDPDFLGNHRISVFGNDVVSAFNNRSSKQAPLLAQGNDIYIYDFATSAVSTPYSEMMRHTGLVTITGGAHTILSDGSVFTYFTNLGIGSIYNAAKASIHYFGVMAGNQKVSVGAAPRVYEPSNFQE